MENEGHADNLMEIGTASNGARGLSLLRDAEQKRSEREKSLFLDIPSWDGSLIGEYRLIDKNELTKLAERQIRRFRQGDRDTLKNDIELIVLSCVGLYARDPESGDRVSIEDEFGIVKYDRIGKVLGKDEEIKSASDAVKYLTAEREENGVWEENSIAIGIHAQSISRWMRDPSKRTFDIEELLGEI